MNIEADETFVQWHFPKAGIDISMGFGRQTPRQIGGPKDWARTTPLGINVRGFEPVTNRDRGGSRCGLSKWINAQPSATEWITQELNILVRNQSVQTSLAGRIVTVVAVSQGNVFTAVSGDTAWSAVTNNTGETPPLNYSGIMQSTALNQKLYFADGVNWVYYNPSTNSLETWAASAGSLPEDSSNNTPRLICTWRGRIICAGLLLDPHAWFMSAVDDATDWNYSPASITPTQAIAGQNAPQAVVGDVITALIPYTDDVLVFGGDHTIWMMRGDPMAGGQLDLVSDAIGMAWGQAWTKDPYGNIYFVSNRTGIYTLVPGQAPQRISQAIESLVESIDTGTNVIRLIWDDRFQGLHMFVTDADEIKAATHYFYEQRTGAWWQDKFANDNHNPLCCVTFDGNKPDDRVALIGSSDGYVRVINPDAVNDDGWDIASSVVIGPLLTQDLDDVLFKDIQAVLGAASEDVTFEVFVGTTAEIALSSTAVMSGTWKAGRNLTNHIRRSGHAIYVKLTSTKRWAMESVRLRLSAMGKVRRRGA